MSLDSDNDDQNQTSCRFSDSSQGVLDTPDETKITDNSLVTDTKSCQGTEDEYELHIQKMREKHRLHQQKRRSNETPDQRAARLERSAERQRLKRQNLTDEEKLKQREAARLQQKERRARESEDKKEIRKIKDRMRMREKRALIKQVSDLGPDIVAQSCVQLLNAPSHNALPCKSEDEVAPYTSSPSSISLNLSSLLLDPAFTGISSQPLPQTDVPAATKSNATSQNLLKLDLNDVKNGNVLLSLANPQFSHENNGTEKSTLNSPIIPLSDSGTSASSSNYLCNSPLFLSPSTLKTLTYEHNDPYNAKTLSIPLPKLSQVIKNGGETVTDPRFPLTFTTQNTDSNIGMDANIAAATLKLFSGSIIKDLNETNKPTTALPKLSKPNAVAKDPRDSSIASILPFSPSLLDTTSIGDTTTTSLPLPSTTLYTVAKDYLATEHVKYLVQKEKSKLRCRARRANETSDQREMRLKKSAERQRRKRSHLTEQEKEIVNEKNRERAKRRRSLETPEEKDRRKSVERIRRQQQRQHFKQSANLFTLPYTSTHHGLQMQNMVMEPASNAFINNDSYQSIDGMQDMNSNRNVGNSSCWIAKEVEDSHSSASFHNSSDISSVLHGINPLVKFSCD